MVKKIKTLILSLNILLGLGVVAAVPAMAADVQGSLCGGAQNLKIDSTQACNTLPGETGTVNNLITKVINIFSAIVGVVAVIMIVVGGFRYITSGGSSEKVSSAKNTILYAIIGLVIVALAQAIARFVLNKASTA